MSRPPQIRAFANLNITMGAHKLTKKERAKGLRKALRSWRTPPWLKPSIRRYLKRMESELRRDGRLERNGSGKGGT